MLVRFKQQYSGLDLEMRISYELVTNELVEGYYNGRKCLCFNTKVLGLIAASLLERATDEDIPAIDVVVKLTNE